MSLLEAFVCPYCGAALLRESYYVRCGTDHRFTASFRSASATPPGSDGSPAAEGGAGLVLRVIGHPRRAEIGRLHLFPLDEP